MEFATGGGGSSSDDDKVLTLCKIVPFWQSSSNNSAHQATSYRSSTSSSSSSFQHHQIHRLVDGSSTAQASPSMTVSSIAKSFLPARRRLRLDPTNKLYFPYEPGKQVKSAITLKNICKSRVAFKFQTTAPKSCYMRPPGGILAPGESIVATVFKFVELPENSEKPLDHKSKVKFKIMSLKLAAGETDYLPELFEEQRDQVSVEQILRVVFLDPSRPSVEMDKLKRQLAEAEAAIEVRRKPPPENVVPGQRLGAGLVVDEWKERRERYLAQQHGEAMDLV